MSTVADLDTVQMFPMMLYHKTLDPKTVKNKGEMDAAFVAGFSTSPSGITQEEILEKKREALAKELEDIDHTLAMIRGEVEDEDGEDGVNMLSGIEGGLPAPPPASLPNGAFSSSPSTTKGNKKG